tara:strand:+ start:7005 stop:7307 length:303 start_codon:yes stop_codon:yes gene_type:complete
VIYIKSLIGKEKYGLLRESHPLRHFPDKSLKNKDFWLALQAAGLKILCITIVSQSPAHPIPFFLFSGWHFQQCHQWKTDGRFCIENRPSVFLLKKNEALC